MTKKNVCVVTFFSVLLSLLSACASIDKSDMEKVFEKTDRELTFSKASSGWAILNDEYTITHVTIKRGDNIGITPYINVKIGNADKKTYSSEADVQITAAIVVSHRYRITESIYVFSPVYGKLAVDQDTGNVYISKLEMEKTLPVNMHSKSPVYYFHWHAIDVRRNRFGFSARIQILGIPNDISFIPYDDGTATLQNQTEKAFAEIGDENLAIIKFPETKNEYNITGLLPVINATGISGGVSFDVKNLDK